MGRRSTFGVPLFSLVARMADPLSLLVRPATSPVVGFHRLVHQALGLARRRGVPADLAASVRAHLGLRPEANADAYRQTGLPDPPPPSVTPPGRSVVADAPAPPGAAATAGDGATGAVLSPALQAWLARHGGRDWPEVAGRVAAAPDYAAAEALVAPLLRSEPTLQLLFLAAHAPAPFPSRTLEQLGMLDRPTVGRLARSRVGGGIPVTREQMRRAVDATPYDVFGAVYCRPGVLGQPNGRFVPNDFALALPLSEWWDAAGRSHHLASRLLLQSATWVDRRLRAGDQAVYAQLRAVPKGVRWRVVDTLRDGGGRAVDQMLWPVAADAWESSDAWHGLCHRQPTQAVRVLELWTAGAPPWWTTAMAARLLQSAPRDQRLAVVQALSRLRRPVGSVASEDQGAPGAAEPVAVEHAHGPWAATEAPGPAPTMAPTMAPPAEARRAAPDGAPDVTSTSGEPVPAGPHSVGDARAGSTVQAPGRAVLNRR